MKAVRVHRFGGPEVLSYEDVAEPVPADGQVLVAVAAAGVGPWDAWVRAGKSAVPQPLPLTLGSDLAGRVVGVGAGVTGVEEGAAVFGVTNARFTGAQAELAVAEAAMLASKPPRLSDVEACSVPVVATTAWQMVFDHGHVEEGQRVLVLGAAGNVGAYAVQLAKRVGAHVIGTAFTKDVDFVRSLGASEVIDASAGPFEQHLDDIDVVVDTIGGSAQDQAFTVLRPGGTLVSSVAPPNADKAKEHRVRAAFFLVEVTTAGLAHLAELLASGALKPTVGEVMPLDRVRTAHEMLAGEGHRRGKIVLTVRS